MSESRSSSLSRQEPPNDKANKFPKDGQKSVNDTQDQVQLSTTAQNEQSLRSHEAGKRKRTEESLGDKSTLNEKEEEKRMKM